MTSDSDSRRRLAIVCNSLPPYRVNLHRVLARGIPELRLETLVTHGATEFAWQEKIPEEIHAVHFSQYGEAAHGGMLVAPWTDWKKGGEMIRYLKQRDFAAVIFSGYGYPSHLRLLQNLVQRKLPFFLCNDSNSRCDRARTTPFRRWLKQRFFHWANPRAAGIMPMGTLGAEYYASYGVPRDKMYFVPCTPDYDWFAEKDSAGVNAILKRFSLSGERKRLLYSGRFHPLKRVDLLIDAFAAIAAERPDWDLVLVGAGPVEDELRKRVPPELVGRVCWPGFLGMEELRNVYHACDVLVQPSDYEPWALVVQEAMSAGLPVVASDIVGAARDLVAPGVNGFIFPCGDLPKLTECLRVATRAESLDPLKAAAITGLAAWRRRVDVVREVRRALHDAGAIASL